MLVSGVNGLRDDQNESDNKLFSRISGSYVMVVFLTINRRALADRLYGSITPKVRQGSNPKKWMWGHKSQCSPVKSTRRVDQIFPEKTVPEFCGQLQQSHNFLAGSCLY